MAAGDDHLEHALGLAHRYLNRRERTTAEVRRYLERRGVSPPVVESALSDLGEQGYLDDARFARLFTEDKRELERWGSERIRRALYEHGVGRDLVEEALAEHGSDASELERAVALLRRRFPLAPAEPRERDRARAVLLRKGYESELATDAVRSYLREAR